MKKKLSLTSLVNTNFDVHCVPKNETRVIFNILYSCKSTAMKFSRRVMLSSSQ